MADLPTLQARLENLKVALASGYLTVDYNGRHVTYRSIADIQAAIKDVETDINGLKGTAFVRTYHMNSRKGL